MPMQRIALILVAATLGATVAFAGETPSPTGAKAYFVDLRNGDVVASPIAIKFGLSGMALVPAGEQKPNTGHHHLIVDTAIEGAALSEPIPADEQHVHFGKGQAETTLSLPKGTHTLQLVLGDWTHVPHNPPVMSERITITVK
jgi:hypothetical protein